MRMLILASSLNSTKNSNQHQGEGTLSNLLSTDVQDFISTVVSTMQTLTLLSCYPESLRAKGEKISNMFGREQKWAPHLKLCQWRNTGKEESSKKKEEEFSEHCKYLKISQKYPHLSSDTKFSSK